VRCPTTLFIKLPPDERPELRDVVRHLIVEPNFDLDVALIRTAEQIRSRRPRCFGT
jgi:hypothetical protein